MSWDQSTVKLVAEDQDGCFLTTTVEATGNPVWTITSEVTRDCGPAKGAVVRCAAADVLQRATIRAQSRVMFSSFIEVFIDS